MLGKRGVAPCGHEGEHIIANYVKCLRGCDSVKTPASAKPIDRLRKYVVSFDLKDRTFISYVFPPEKIPLDRVLKVHFSQPFSIVKSTLIEYRETSVSRVVSEHVMEISVLPGDWMDVKLPPI